MGTVGKAGRGFKLAIASFVSFLVLPAHATPPPEGDILLISPSRLEGLLHQLPSAQSYNHLFEHFFLPSMFSIEENAGFSDIDPELLSLYGQSAFWTEWQLEGLDLSDPVFSGAAAFKVPFEFLSALELRHGVSARTLGAGGVSFEVSPRAGQPKRRVGATVTASELGGIFPLAYPVMEAFSGIHSRRRDPPPPDDRRHMKERVQLHLLDEVALGASTRVRYALEVDLGERHFLDFPTARPADLSSFDERFTRISSIFELAPPDRSQRIYGLVEYRARTNLFAERGYRAAETVNQETFGLLLGMRQDDLHFGLTFKHYEHRANDPNFSRELVDLDGEGLAPYGAGGRTEAIRLQLRDRMGPLYLDLNLRTLLFSPDHATTLHELSYFGAPYGSMEVSSQTAVTWIGQHRAGFLHEEQLGVARLRFDGFLNAFHAHPGSAAPLFFFDVGLETELSIDVAPAFQPFILLAKSPVPITTQLAYTLNPELLQTRERLQDGRLIRTTGGGFARLGDGLSATNIYTLATGFESALGRGWRFAGQGLVQLFDHTHRFELDGGAEAYGQTIDGVYYFDEGETRYVLEETPRSEMPVYFGGHLQFQQVVPNEHFFVLSFAVLNSIGYPAPLNGPFGNDIGYVDFSSANPNANVNRRANLDNDRAFVFRMAAGLRFWQSLWGSLTVAHRDGQPFAYYEDHVRDGQVATTFSTTRGSPLKYTRPFTGPREDFMLSVDLELSYIFALEPGLDLRLALLGANLLDFGNEIAEINQRAFKDARAALESELPRSLLITLELLQ